KYVRFLQLFVLSVAFALLIAYLYLRYTIPVYNVSGSMLIRSEQPGGQRNELDELISGNKASNINNEIEILKSRPLMERVVDTLDLELSYSAKGKIKTVNIYKQGPFRIEVLEIVDSTRKFTLKIKFQNEKEFRFNDDKNTFSFGQVFRNAHGVFRLVRNPNSSISKEYAVTWTPNYTAASEYAGAIQVNLKSPGTGILFVSMRTTNSSMGADIINKLMDEYGRYSVEQKNKASVSKLVFIDDRLSIYRKKIDSVQGILNAFERENKLLDSKAQSDNMFDRISEADKLVNEQTLKLNVTEIVSGYLRDKRNQYEKVPTTLNLDDVTLNQLVTEYNKWQITRQQLLDGNVPAGNPAVKEANDQIEKLRTSIQENLKNIRSSLVSSINTVKGTTRQSETTLQALPPIVKEQLQKQGEVESLQALYKFLQEEKEKQAIMQSANVSNSDIINKAFASTVPVKPNRRAIQMLAVLLGLGLPALIIFLSEILNDKVSTRFDIEKITAAPILGEIGHSYSDKVLVVNKTTRSMVAEQFRIIRSNLQYILNKKEKSTILFTSSFSGEGKSYVTTNMGAVLALAGKKTIILEFDIRKPKIMSGLGIPKGPGITNFLIGNAELKDLVKLVPDQENLYVLGCGPIPPNPAELLLDKKMDELFAWLKENFDIILVDTAPVGMVSDAMTLSKFADSTLYLVRQGHTFKKQIGLIDEFYKENKLPKVSIIINDVKIKPGYGYYGYGRYGYGYGYGYGSYYEEEVPPRNFIERVAAWFDVRRFFGKTKKRKK
ncbi:MAG: polysaccharide biosynthesis tyrosine autokinase, partial [Ferruginibacter sp.]|nr:polysaccharide biosynthesis tyrosine autokinase [Chitinophagaceae bacterium]